MDHRPLNILSLCAGVGGLDLGIRVAQPDARTVCYVEIEAFACEILATRMEDKSLDEAPVWTDLRSFNGKPWRGSVDIVTAGYPCQPFSVAGKQKGKDDPRHLWPDVFRVVREVRPKICFFENVPGHLRLGFEQVHDDLSGLGYSVKAGLFSAQEVGSSHKRERLFILAYRESDYRSGWLSEIRERGSAYPGRQPSMADSPCLFCERPEPEGNQERQSEMPSGSLGGELADAYHAGFQETGTEFFTERTGGDIGQLGHAEYAGSSTSQITRGAEKDDGAKGEAKSVSGQLIPPVTIHKKQITSWSATFADREKFGSVQAEYHDKALAEKVKVTAGDGNPVFTLRHTYDTPELAMQNAKSKLERLRRGTGAVGITLPGNTRFIAEGKIDLVGVRAGVDGQWVLTRVEHSFNGSGYQCRLDGEIPKN